MHRHRVYSTCLCNLNIKPLLNLLFLSHYKNQGLHFNQDILKRLAPIGTEGFGCKWDITLNNQISRSNNN